MNPPATWIARVRDAVGSHDCVYLQAMLENLDRVQRGDCRTAEERVAVPRGLVEW